MRFWFKTDGGSGLRLIEVMWVKMDRGSVENYELRFWFKMDGGSRLKLMKVMWVKMDRGSVG